MPEFFLELFSEEIPARMQAEAALALQRRCDEALAPLLPRDQRTWHGARRIAYRATVDDMTAAPKGSALVARGPRLGAPERALDGFLNKHGAVLAELDEADGYYVLKREHQPESAARIIAEALPSRLAKFTWPKSMRWGESGDFTWVRPLRRITCLLDGEIVPITLGPVTAGNESEGHRFMAPGTFKITNAAEWEAELDLRFVMANAEVRRRIILLGLRAQAMEKGLTLIEDEALLDEVTGLVEWPVPLIGKIDPRYMTLPPEVRALSMKVNQRYFTLRDAAGNPVPYFAFVANIETGDGGAAIIAGNERVLRARLADAEHFWNQDRKCPLANYLPKLKGVTFHAKLGSQYERAQRIAALSRELAELVGADSHEMQQAEIAGRLAKADLVTGMVGEFPELQGIIGGYYADDAEIGVAIRTHYQPKGPNDEVPRGVISCAVALADKLDTLREFFKIGEKPTGSGDPYALRRAALGIIRIILENDLHLSILALSNNVNGLFEFFIERLYHKLKSEGDRPDILEAAFASSGETDLVRLMHLVDGLKWLLDSEDGANLLTAYRRASNILRTDEYNDGQNLGSVSQDNLVEDAERKLFNVAQELKPLVQENLQAGKFLDAMRNLAALRPLVDEFFDQVTVNVSDGYLRRNRRGLLVQLRDMMHTIANFSKIEG